MPATYQSSDVTGYTDVNGTTTYEADDVVTSADSGLRIDLQLSTPDGANNAVTVQAFDPNGLALTSPIVAGATDSNGLFTNNFANIFGDYFTTLDPGTYTVRITASAPDGSSLSVDQPVQYEAPSGGGGSPPPATVALTSINGFLVTGNDELPYEQVATNLNLSGTTTNSGGTVDISVYRGDPFTGTPLPSTFQSTLIDAAGNFSIDPAAAIEQDENSTTIQPGLYTIAVDTFDQNGNATTPFLEELTIDQPAGGGGGGGTPSNSPSFNGLVDNLTPGSSADADWNGSISQLLPGDVVNFQLFTDSATPVTVSSGAPTLQLDNGAQAIFTGTDASGALDFAYTVQQSPSDSTGDLQVTGLNLNGASIADADGNQVSAANPVTLETNFIVNADAPTVAFTQGLVASGGARNPDRASIFTFDGTVSNLTSGPGSHVEIFSYDPNQNDGLINDLGSAKLHGDGTWTMKNVDVGADASTTFFAEAVSSNAAGDPVSFSEIVEDPFGITDKNDPNLPERTVNVRTGAQSDTGANFVYTPGSGQETINHFDLAGDTLQLPKGLASQFSSGSTHGSNIPGGFEFNNLPDVKGLGIGPIDLLGPDVNKNNIHTQLIAAANGFPSTFKFG